VTTSKYASLVQLQGERAASKDHRVQALAENHHLVELGHHGLLQGAASRYPDRPESFRTVQLADLPPARRYGIQTASVIAALWRFAQLLA
jgi:hypothetical protein